MISGPRRTWLAVGAACGVAIGIAVGIGAADYQKSPKAAATRSWHGKVGRIARAGADKAGGLIVRGVSGETARDTPALEGTEVAAGTHLVTDARTRARVVFDDGTSMVLDRDTELAVMTEPRTLSMAHGALVADVATVQDAPDARIITPNGSLEVGGSKLAVTSTDQRTSVEVVRGAAKLSSGSSEAVVVNAGQEGVAAGSGPIEVTPANDLAQRMAFGERIGAGTDRRVAAESPSNPDAEAPMSGLGELRARRPGKTDEKDHAVHLASHAAKVRIVGNQAKTEIDEVFSNDTGDDLEGVYRFPLPPSAQIERLALEVDGKLVEGAFVDKAKGAAIWRGAIQNAAPKATPVTEEIFWVPGRWRDPALLEWQRGGRFELKIFPIPKRGSRRIVLAYTETVAPVAGVRRYVYPLPQSTASTLRIDSFGLDVQVLGADPKVPVQAKGYELTRSEASGVRLAQTMTGFTPSGDLAIEYALAGDRTSDVSAWAFVDDTLFMPATAVPAVAPQWAAPTVARVSAVPPAPVNNDPYVALALRPKLPRWSDVRPRDQVLVVDVGRAMFGERFARARRLAEQVTEEMDRRDRLTVLVCDVTCRTMPGGFRSPGAGGAHDVDAFLADVTPDGASDLVGAMRAAASVSGHDPARDLRVVLLSDGAASAGYRRTERLSDEVASAIADGRAEVVAVPIGADADVVALGEIARGGGGVVVPYAPGEELETAALDVLNATYGTTLRDVELTLPDGLHDAAPHTLAPLRAGSETIVTARMTGNHVQGEAILRGKVGGEPFEARYPLDLKATSDPGNGFVPRLFAAARIADEERAGDGARADVVQLSQRFAVPSRFTSLLVLESEAMFHAFGIERDSRAPVWTGESESVGTEVATAQPSTDGADKDAFGAIGLLGGPGVAAQGVGSGGGGRGEGFGAGGLGLGSLGHAAASPAAPPPAPAATMAPKEASPAKASRRASVSDLSAGDSWNARRRGGEWMKKVWFRKASVGAPSQLPIASEKLAAARSAVAAAPDERGKTKELVRVLAVDGLLDELDDVVRKWSERDPLDADAIAARADLLARRGDRDGALRVLGGVTASLKPSAPADGAQVESLLGLANERAGKPEACAFRVAAAELRPEDADAVARAVACERTGGHASSADRWIGIVKATLRDSVSTLAAKYEPALRGSVPMKENTASGDIVVDATWDASLGADLDIVIIDPQGNRAAWSGRMKSVRVQDPLTRAHESVAFSTSASGPFTVELVRSDEAGARAGGTTLSSGARPQVSGQVTVRSFGTSTTRPFIVSGARAQVARVDVSWDSRLVAIDGPDCNPPFEFDAQGIKRMKPECQ